MLIYSTSMADNIVTYWLKWLQHTRR